MGKAFAFKDGITFKSFGVIGWNQQTTEEAFFKFGGNKKVFWRESASGELEKCLDGIYHS